MYSEKYCTAEVTNVESALENSGLRFPERCVNPLICGYLPDIYVNIELK